MSDARAEAALSQLRSSKYLRLTTYRRDGTPVATPVWFAMTDECWFVYSSGTAGKVKRLRHTSAVLVAACDMRGGVKGPAFKTEALLTDADHDKAAGYAALAARYGWQLRVATFLSWVGRRLDNRQMIRVVPPVSSSLVVSV